MTTLNQTAHRLAAAAAMAAASAFAADTYPQKKYDLNHWAYQPLAKPAVPAPKDKSWPKTDLDRFIRADQEAKALAPNAQADRGTLIRRAYYDLIGLPPTPEEVIAFEADNDPKAYEKLVSQLLASPHYGERWGRHWLDLARYADSNGYRYDDDQPTAYHYRDFVIKAFNEDLPFDQFVQWQLAGNEIAPGNIDAMTANGFCAIGPMERDEGPPLVRKGLRSDELDDLVSTTASSMLALTVACARCHDHKFDPIYTKEYYQLVRTFNGGKREVRSVDRPVKPGLEGEKAAFEKDKAELLAEFQAWDDANRAAIEPVFLDLKSKLDAYHAQVSEQFAKENPDAPPGYHAKEFDSLAYSGIRRYYFGNEGAGKYQSVRKDYYRLNDFLDGYNPLQINEIAKSLSEPAKTEFEALDNRLKRLKRSPFYNHDQVLVYADSQPEPVKTHLLIRGSSAMPGEELQQGFISVLTAPDYQPPARPANAGDNSYQRAALADWMTNVDKGAGRLLARVMVNRMWHYHFGQGLVRTPNDFGIQGDKPENPALLDWLSRKFIESGWSIKSMHTLIMESAVYRQSADFDLARSEIDPDNRLWWRRVPQRLTSEILRDAILATSGQLNTEFSGPGVMMPIPKEAIITRAGRPYPTNIKDSHETHRRSVYAYVKRTVPIPLIQIFDGADSSLSCGERIPTTVPTQALTLMNNDAIRARSVDFAERVSAIVPDSAAAQAELAFELALSRKPDPEEQTRLEAFFASQLALREGDRKAALADLCHVIFNLNEFIYVN